MRVISTGSIYRIFGDNMETHDKFPVGTYNIRFEDMVGFYAEKRRNFEIGEKVYGGQSSKAEKVVKSFKLFSRNLGVIMSGDKGIGKSLTAKMIAIEAIKNDIPVFICDFFHPALMSYIESIDQEVMVMFDEFDKKFSKNEDQDKMLSLFDGTSVGKKLFVVTCNEIRSMSDYMVNRPGRFHYHLRFDYPTAEDIKVYLMDHLEEQYYSSIDAVIKFSRRINLNYDCLRAIAFEINTGLSFSDAIKDLNIVSYNSSVQYGCIIDIGEYGILKGRICGDLFAHKDETIYCYDCIESIGSNGVEVVVSFNCNNVKYDPEKFLFYVDPKDVKISVNDNDEPQAVKEAVKKVVPHSVVIRKSGMSNIHYEV